jgi:hypothetical protein
MMMKADKKRRFGVALGLGELEMGELEISGSGVDEGVEERDVEDEGVGVVVGVDDDVDDCDLELFRVDDGVGGDLDEVADAATSGDLVKVAVVTFVMDGVRDTALFGILVGDGVFEEEEENENDGSDWGPWLSSEAVVTGGRPATPGCKTLPRPNSWGKLSGSIHG